MTKIAAGQPAQEKHYLTPEEQPEEQPATDATRPELTPLTNSVRAALMPDVRKEIQTLREEVQTAFEALRGLAQLQAASNNEGVIATPQAPQAEEPAAEEADTAKDMSVREAFYANVAANKMPDTEIAVTLKNMGICVSDCPNDYKEGVKKVVGFEPIIIHAVSALRDICTKGATDIYDAANMILTLCHPLFGSHDASVMTSPIITGLTRDLTFASFHVFNYEFMSAMQRVPLAYLEDLARVVFKTKARTPYCGGSLPDFVNVLANTAYNALVPDNTSELETADTAPQNTVLYLAGQRLRELLAEGVVRRVPREKYGYNNPKLGKTKDPFIACWTPVKDKKTSVAKASKSPQ